MKRRDFLALSSLTALAACVREPPSFEDANAEAARGSKESGGTLVVVEVWHDLICPWCRIGLHNLRGALAGFRDRPVEVRHHPYLLNPDAPPEGKDLRAELEGKYGPGSFERMFARVTEVGAGYGVRFDWDKVRVSPATAPAHALLEAVTPTEQPKLLDALHVAYFEQGRNFGLPDELAAIAASVGIEKDRAIAVARDPKRIADVRARAARAPAAGVRGVPHFRIGQETLRGAQPPEALRAAIVAAT